MGLGVLRTKGLGTGLDNCTLCMAGGGGGWLVVGGGGGWWWWVAVLVLVVAHRILNWVGVGLRGFED